MPLPRPATLLRLIRLHPVAALLFGAGTLFALVFVARTLFFVVYWSDLAHRNQAPAGWMTPRYIAHSWQIPHEALAEALQIPDPPPSHATLAEIARLRGMSTEALIAELTVFLALHRQMSDG